MARGLGHQKRRRLIGRQEREISPGFPLSSACHPLSLIFSLSLSLVRTLSLSPPPSLSLCLLFLSRQHPVLFSRPSCSRNSKFPLLVRPRLSTQKQDGRSSLNFTKLPFSQVPFEISAFPSRICGISLALHRREMQFFPSFFFFFFLFFFSPSLPSYTSTAVRVLRLRNRSSCTFVSLPLSLFSATFLIGGSSSAYG